MSRQTSELEAELREAQARADRAERELNAVRGKEDGGSDSTEGDSPVGGEEALRREPMMAHLMDSLSVGRDIGHYGRLVFAMVARHFLSHEDLLGWLAKDPDFSTEAAHALLRQVEGRDYNPPRRERILEWQKEQDFPILPNAEDPDCGNVYRNLKFPDRVYEHIQDYQEEKAEAAEATGNNGRAA